MPSEYEVTKATLSRSQDRKDPPGSESMACTHQVWLGTQETLAESKGNEVFVQDGQNQDNTYSPMKGVRLSYSSEEVE